MTTLRDFVSHTESGERLLWIDGLKMYVQMGAVTLDEAKQIAGAKAEADVRSLLDKIENFR